MRKEKERKEKRERERKEKKQFNCFLPGSGKIRKKYNTGLLGFAKHHPLLFNSFKPCTQIILI